MANKKVTNDISNNPNALPLDGNYWSMRYHTNDTRWDLKEVSPPIKSYINQITDKKLRILIPGCGNAYEAVYLYSQGFTNITIVDIAATVVQSLQQKFKDTTIKVVQQNIFDHSGSYDLIIEQTLFCAIDVSLRPQYTATMSRLLTSGGKLTGLLFNTQFVKEGPPFGGTEEEYRNLFSKHFLLHTIAPCYNSIESRAGTELFIIFLKK
jgi:methyl halide transferase